MKQLVFFSFPEYLSRLSGCGDPLEVLSQIVKFEDFRCVLGLKYADGSRRGQIVDATLVSASSADDRG